MKELRHKSSIELRKRVAFKLCESTADTYASLFDRLLVFCNESRPLRISRDQIYEWLYTFNGYSQKNQAINAVKFYFKHVEYKKVHLTLTRPKKPKRIPRDIPFDRILLGFDKIKNKKHRALTVLMFSCGLRRSEVVSFRLEWIIREDRLIKVTGKGNKQRLVPYDESTMNILNEYAEGYKPKDFLFSGQGNKKYSFTSLANICRKYFDCSPHQLRHSYAMKLQENGVNLSIIKDLLGHESIKTTLAYLRTPKSELNKITILSLATKF